MSEVKISNTKDREIKMSRLINAPRELVFKVWTDPKHIAQWWGPNGFTTTTHEMELKPGGEWRFIMHGPDGRDYPNKIIYIDVEEPERLVYIHGNDDDTEPVNFHVTVTFEKEGDKTRLTMQSIFESAEELQRLDKEHGAIEGGKQHLNRLEEYLTKL